MVSISLPPSSLGAVCTPLLLGLLGSVLGAGVSLLMGLV